MPSSDSPQPSDVSAPLLKKEGPISKGKKILIIEDERPLSHALDMKLRKEGFETTVVMNGHDGIEEVRNGKYDMVLLDLIMPVMDGFTVLKEMAVMGQKIPVIVLSNLGQDEDCEKAKKMGALDYFVKSNTPISDILKRVISALS
jgi:DNA-binding response OmpR family regulator